VLCSAQVQAQTKQPRVRDVKLAIRFTSATITGPQLAHRVHPAAPVQAIIANNVGDEFY
jgi:hypothetical protein